MSATLTLPEKARQLFELDDVPEDLGWIAWLSPSHLRLFAGEVYAAIQAEASEEELESLIEGWRGTAELDLAPEVRASIERNRASERFVSVDEWLNRRHSA